MATQFAEPMGNMTNHFDMEDPAQALSAYQRSLHQHTKSQLETATTSARRRSAGTTPTSLSPSASISSQGSADRE